MSEEFSLRLRIEYGSELTHSMKSKTKQQSKYSIQEITNEAKTMPFK